MLVAAERRLLARQRPKLGVEERGDLARDPVDREAVGPVPRHLDLQDVLAERKHVAKRRPRLVRLGQDEDPGVLVAQPELGLGEDHPVGDAAAELRPLERPPVGKHGARQGDRDGCALAEVPGAADDLARLPLPHVDPAQLEPVRVRMLSGLDHAADEVAAVVSVLVGDAAVGDALDLAGGDGEAVDDLLRGRVHVDVLAQPGHGNLHVKTA